MCDSVQEAKRLAYMGPERHKARAGPSPACAAGVMHGLRSCALHGSTWALIAQKLVFLGVHRAALQCIHRLGVAGCVPLLP